MEKCLRSVLLCLTICFFNCSRSVSEDISENYELEDGLGEIGSPVARPNILLVIADDMGLDATPDFAHELNAIKPNMPTLQGLMGTGLVFDNLWSYALCSPTRASILTGRHGIHTSVLSPIKSQLSGDFISLQKYINENTANAYANAVFGKWHLGAVATHPTQTMGIETYAGNLGGGVPDFWEYTLVEDEVSRMLSASNDAERKENYSTTKYTQLAIDWKENQTKPWFLWLAYNAAHTPFHRPDASLISEESSSRNETNLYNYLAMLEAMDSELGRFLDSMPSEERENTLVIFIGDNGSPKKASQYPDKSKHSKGSIYQGGINVPMVVSGMGTRAGREENALVHTVDLFATIAEFAGVNSTEIYNSVSFKSLLKSETAGVRDFIYTEVPNENDSGSYAVRNRTYKLIHEIDTGREELYNLLDDKYETTDLMIRDLTDEESYNLEALKQEGNRIRGE